MTDLPADGTHWWRRAAIDCRPGLWVLPDGVVVVEVGPLNRWGVHRLLVMANWFPKTRPGDLCPELCVDAIGIDVLGWQLLDPYDGRVLMDGNGPSAPRLTVDSPIAGQA